MKVFSLSVILLLSSLHSLGQSDLQAYLDSIQLDSQFKYSSVFAEVRTLDSAHSIFSYNGHKAAIPASSLKLVSSLLLLEQLGPDFRYETVIGYKGNIHSKGVLSGDLIIKASGDPSLGSNRFKENNSLQLIMERISNALSASGIQSIRGDIILDLSVFDQEYIHPTWEWGDLGWYYGAGVFAVNINDNELKIQIDATGNKGDMAKVLSIDPPVPLPVKVEVKVVDETYTEGLEIQTLPESNIFSIYGSLGKRKKNHTLYAAIPDPPDLFIFHLQKLLDSLNINYSQIRKQYHEPIDTTGWSRIVVFRSPPLEELIAQTLKHSLNLYSEVFLKTFSLINGKKATRKNGIELIRQRLRDFGFDIGPLNLKDGSGLSAQNLISPGILAGLLDTLVRTHGVEKFLPLLPLAGAEGTVKSMLKDTPALGNVWMKSGSISNVLSYTGLCKAKSGTWCSFSIIFNNSSLERKHQRQKMTEIINIIYETN